MIGPRPVAPARWLLAVTVVVLPAGEIRDRYREEFRVELCEIGGGRQLYQAGTLLLGAFRLRSALVDRDLPVAAPRPDWRCRVGRHRYLIVQDDNPEMRGRPYLRCARCGRPKDPPKYGPMPPGSVADSASAGGGGF